MSKNKRIKLLENKIKVYNIKTMLIKFDDKYISCNNGTFTTLEEAKNSYSGNRVFKILNIKWV